MCFIIIRRSSMHIEGKVTGLFCKVNNLIASCSLDLVTPSLGSCLRALKVELQISVKWQNATTTKKCVGGSIALKVQSLFYHAVLQAQHRGFHCQSQRVTYPLLVQKGFEKTGRARKTMLKPVFHNDPLVSRRKESIQLGCGFTGAFNWEINLKPRVQAVSSYSSGSLT